jgi:predicted DNA-binding transcriptional regulator YafY
MRVSRIHRLLRLITLLQGSQTWSVEELAVELQVSRRTVFRDLNMLEMAHIPYHFDRERKSYRINGHYFLPPVNLDLTEALSLMLMAVRQGKGGVLPWPAHARRAAIKLEEALPAPVRQHIGAVLDNMEIRHTPPARDEGVDAILDQLTQAIARRRVCQLVYLSFHDRKQVRLQVHPLRLVFVQRAWYVLGRVAGEKDIRTFKLARIRRVTVEDQTFTPPPPGVVESHFGQAWSMIPEGKCHDIHLHFAAKVAGNVAEVQWHPSQKVEWRDDGSIDFRVRVDGLGEITWWILGYGDSVRVLAPPALVKKVGGITRGMAALYEGSEVRP